MSTKLGLNQTSLNIRFVDNCYVLSGYLPLSTYTSRRSFVSLEFEDEILLELSTTSILRLGALNAFPLFFQLTSNGFSPKSSSSWATLTIVDMLTYWCQTKSNNKLCISTKNPFLKLKLYKNFDDESYLIDSLCFRFICWYITPLTTKANLSIRALNLFKFENKYMIGPQEHVLRSKSLECV